MDTQEKKGKELNAEEEKEFRDGSALYEMVQTSGGWQVVNKILEGAAYHTWVNPLDCASEKEFVWKELVAYSAAKNAQELLETIASMISRSQHLGKVKSGEVQKPTMRF